MIRPELLEYVAKEAEKEVHVMKQVRKAREERKLLRGPNNKKGKDGGGE